MNVNDLHPKFQLDLTDIEKSPNIIKPDENWNDIVLGEDNWVTSPNYFNISFSDFPTKTGGTYSLNTRQLTFTSIETTPPSSFSAVIDLNVNPFYSLEYIEFTFEDGTTNRWVNGDTFIFNRIGNSKTYLVNDTSWSRATKIIGRLRVLGPFGREVNFSKNTILSTIDITPNDKHKILYFNYYPSGLLIKVESRQENSDNLLITCNLQTHCLTATQGTVMSIILCSPVPKTYCFFDSNNTNLWTITSGSWNYNKNTHFWEQQISFSQSSNIYYFPSNISASISFTKMIFIDPMLWDYRDSWTVNADQTADNVALYPICKTEGTNTYFINNVSLSGTYNFLTSYGALYQYPENQINKLKDGYVTIQSDTGQYDIGNISSKDVTIYKRNAQSAFKSKMFQQYGSIKNKAIMRDNVFTEDNDRYRADNNTTYLISKSSTTQQILINTVGSIETYWLDEYYLYANNTIYRLSPEYKVILLTRTAHTDFSPSYMPSAVGHSHGFSYTYQSNAYGDGSQMYLHLINTRDEPGTYNSTYTCTYNYLTQKLLKDGSSTFVNDDSNFNSYWRKVPTETITYDYNIALNGYHFKTILCDYVTVNPSTGSILYQSPTYGASLKMSFQCQFDNLYQCNLEDGYKLLSTGYSVVDHAEKHWSDSLYSEEGYTMRRYYHKSSGNTIKIADEINFKPIMPNINGLYAAVGTTALINSSKTFTIYNDNGDKINYTANDGIDTNGNVVALSLSSELKQTDSKNVIRQLCIYKE